ncbi:hypothetical protein PR202_ga26305 [Eleusine coracana subsp. coracana]|uniref:ATPase AAA-type core domain-containing protein n=1 Tax=Eleusine coracana subsp. coracana TaxID=191504 RepID=A0AAV5DDP2_ELECO|nr:hypothetical protein PR202_ga26305 [Eleusine coracana subsp. coracana]
MGGSADPEASTPTPSPSPVKASPSSTDSMRLRRCVQSKLSWGLVKPAAGVGGGGGGGGSGGGGEAGAGPSVPAADVAVEKEECTEEPVKGQKRGRARKPAARRKSSSNKETTDMEPASKDGAILVGESPQKKQRKGRKQDASLKVPNRKCCKALESPDGPGSCQKMDTVLPEARPVLIDIDLMSTPSEVGHTNSDVDVLDNQDKSQLIVDLRSEAKMAAEENRKLSSGKKIHPFFASRKMSKCTNQDVNNTEDVDELCDSESDPPFYPIHVMYQLEVCGNSEHLKFLTEWLKGWDERGHKIGAGNGDTNDSLYQDESDAEYSDDASECENVLLITGPVGCGKSAAVFACAKEQGFNVIEVNTSDMRNGAYVRQKFEEATKSHGLEKCSVNFVGLKNHPCSIAFLESSYRIVVPLQRQQSFSPKQGRVTRGRHLTPRDDSMDPAPGTPDNTEYQHSISCPTTISFDSDKQKSPIACHSSPKLSVEPPKHVINKTLILFEDVDTVFDDDRGFISTILKMAETTKWPIILTSNRKDPSLPNLLDQLVLDFKYPSNSELLSHVDMICKSEGVDVTISQLKQVIDICLGDIRRTVMLLQFWYQGKQQFTERPKECLSRPFSLDLDAVHSTVPKMLPWEFPCKLSERIFNEVDKTILLAEEKKRQLEVSELEGLQLQVTTPLFKGRSTVNRTRKGKKSKLKCGLQTECNDLSPCKNDLDDFHALPDVPLPPDQQRKRNRHSLLLLSDSDDDKGDVNTGKDANLTVKEDFPQCSEEPCMRGPGIFEQFPFPVESMNTLGITDSLQIPLESNMTGSISQVCDTFMSQGVSCVPESSFIVGSASASMSGDDLLSGAVSNDFSAFYNGGTYITSRMVLDDTDNAKNLIAEQPEGVEDVVAETCEAYVESSCRNEPASCSPAGYHLMDECSQAGSIWLFSAKKDKDSCKVEQVQHTWDRLRNCCPELPCETNQNAVVCGALKLASRVSDLISETDLLLSRCYPLTNDMLDPFSIPYAEPDDFSWYNNQVEMGSVYAQHALCIFSRNSQDIDDGESVDLSRELLFASTTAISLVM